MLDSGIWRLVQQLTYISVGWMALQDTCLMFSCCSLTQKLDRECSRPRGFAPLATTDPALIQNGHVKMSAVEMYPFNSPRSMRAADELHTESRDVCSEVRGFCWAAADDKHTVFASRSPTTGRVVRCSSTIAATTSTLHFFCSGACT